MVELFNHFTDGGKHWLCPFDGKDEALFEGLLPSTLGVYLADRIKSRIFMEFQLCSDSWETILVS